MSEEKLKSEFDTPWKKILDLYFEQFVAYCWPARHAEIDWSKGYKSLDKELSKIARNAPVTNRVIDKLMEVHLKKSGNKAGILIHLEVQGQYVLTFEERMFIYRYRLRDLYNLPIASIAILIDSDPNWRPSGYKEELWGSSMEMKFPIIKLLDYRNRIEELEASSNPFAAVILAQLAVMGKEAPEEKLISKVNLIKWLYSKNWKRDDIITLLTFLDWVFALPEPLELQCKEVVETLEEERHVEYVTSWERMGIEKGMQQGIPLGIQQGIQQGESTVLLSLLKHKFKTVPTAYKDKVEQADPDILLRWSTRVLEVPTLEEVFED